MNFDTFDTLDVNSSITPACDLYRVMPDFTSNVSNVSHNGENISPPPDDPDDLAVIDEQSADGDGDAADRAEQIAASRRWRRSATGNPTLMYGGRRVVVVRHVETGVYGFAIDRRWARGRWVSEGAAKLAAAMALLALPRKPRHRPARRADGPVETRWIVARADTGGRDDDDDDFYDDGDANEQLERNA